MSEGGTDFLQAKIDRLTAELERYKRGVEVDAQVTEEGWSFDNNSYVGGAYIEVPASMIGQRVRVLVMKEEA